MLRLTVRQRGLLIEKLPDLANLAMAGLVFGQFLGAQEFSVATGLGGLSLWILGMGLALLAAGGQP